MLIALVSTEREELFDADYADFAGEYRKEEFFDSNYSAGLE